MSPEELRRRTDEVQIVDVRRLDEYEIGGIDGAVHIPGDELKGRLSELERGRPVVAICYSGSRSAQAVAVLAREGFDADNLEGGLKAWTDAGLPFEGRLAAPGGGDGGGDDGGGDGGEGEEEGDGDGEDLPPHLQRLQAEFLSVLMAVQERFGDTEPSDEDVRAFLRQRLIDEGRSPEEADEFLARMDREEPST